MDSILSVNWAYMYMRTVPRLLCFWLILNCIKLGCMAVSLVTSVLGDEEHRSQKEELRERELRLKVVSTDIKVCHKSVDRLQVWG